MQAKKKLYRARTVSVSVAIAFLIIIVFAFVPKYRVVAEGNIYRSPYGETLPVYVKPIFILTEKGADSYGRKLAKRYADRISVLWRCCEKRGYRVLVP